MYSDEAVNYLKNIGYLSDVDPPDDAGADSLWTIGEKYMNVMGTGNELTLQDHIGNYTVRLQSGEINYTGEEPLVLITLVKN